MSDDARSPDRPHGMVQATHGKRLVRRLRAAGLASALVLACLAQTAPASAAAPYEGRVWFTRGHADLDVLVLAAHDPLIGASIDRAFNAWQAGIAYWSPSLSSRLSFRIYWADSGAPPAGFIPDIAVVPQGFMSVSSNPCLVTAPMIAGWGSFDRVTYHEIGHCLGLDHVFTNSVEYKPGVDIMGDGDGDKCPSNLNVLTLENVYAGSGDVVKMDPAQYRQAPSC